MIQNVPLSPQDQAVLLLGETEGWPLAPVIDWLLRDGCLLNDARDLNAGLGRQLVRVGAEISRIRLAFWTLHPLVAAIAHQWHRDGHTDTFEVSHSIFESDKYIGSPAEELRTKKVPVRYRLAEIELDPKKHHSLLFDLRDQGQTDYYAIPMVSFTGQVDSLFLNTDVPGGFTDADIAKFDALARFLLPVIESISQHRLSVALLDTYVGQRTGRRVLEGRIKRGDGEVIKAALWFSDLRDFTHLTETLPAQDLLDHLNSYFEFIYNAVELYDGEVLRFIGDAMLIVFPIERSGGVDQACRNALAAAQDSFNGLATLNHRRKRQGKPEVKFGVGLHLGEVIYGNVGAPTRLDFTVMGPAVNRTARLESLTKQVDRPLLMSDEFIRHIDAGTEDMGAFEVKGMRQPLAAHALKGGL